MKNIHLALQALARKKTIAQVKSAVGGQRMGQWVLEALNQQLTEVLNAAMELERDEYMNEAMGSGFGIAIKDF